MWADVPFTGRTGERQAIRAALHQGRGILIVGEAGAGRNRLLAEAVPWHESVVRVVGMTPETPFGAFAHLLPGTPDPVNPVGWAADRLAADVLVVRDTHLLDASSAALCGHLVRNLGVRLAATALAGAPIPGPLLALWKDGILGRLDLGPLSVHETARLLAGMLGGQVEGLTVRRLWHATQGNPRFLVELVRSGQLAHSGGLWRWHGEFVLTERLRQLIEAAIGEVNEAEREVLEFVAFGPSLDLDALLELVSAEAAERLEGRGLIVLERSAARVRLRHPLFAYVIRTWAGPVRTRHRLAKVMRLRGGDDQEDLQLSAREREVARLASWDLTNREIAELLTVSQRTVGNHLYRIYAKLGVNDRRDLARLLA
ncbi:helix-turn-helix transcriptional regulator [Nonomuraea turcica]|uniref:helix-turn-helix transcriptional regulator n=1 Tax=Nonomuraea sp. G32 TaxID=3067274 RepID=UPI00273C453C|nr:LuxR family transcriptional regulator [Nonomuraea sp. G32]MDP4501173.1 LuxR C-terminal-related transcriptional regulator [Nonomuraea sp. G32]